MQQVIAKNGRDKKALFPSHAKLVICGNFVKPTTKKMLYIKNEFLRELDNLVYSQDRGLAMVHLIALGLSYYMRHQFSGEIDLKLGLLGMVPAISRLPLRHTSCNEVARASSTDDAVGCETSDEDVIVPPVVKIVGRVARKNARGINLSIPDDLYSLCERYTSTSQSHRIESTSATAWICHLSARGLHIVRAQKTQREILINDGFYGVKNFPDKLT
jgi:hypothetical protein